MLNQNLFLMVTDQDAKLPFYVTCVGGWEEQEHVSRPEGLTDFHWMHCTGGAGLLRVEGKEFYIREDMGFFLSPGIPHEYYQWEKPWQTRWILFRGESAPGLIRTLGMNAWGVVSIHRIQRFESYVRSIYSIARSDYPLKGLECSNRLYRFLVMLKTQMTTGRVDTTASSRSSNALIRLQPVISLLEQKYNRTDLSLEEIAGILDLTPQHLCRLFRQAFHMRPMEYLIKLRLQKAKGLLVSSRDTSIRQISELSGFNSESYFCALFKRYEGITPTEFRRLHRSG